ncbi:MAG: sensor histidine kinase [Thermoanaerobaculia bacterium]
MSDLALALLDGIRMPIAVVTEAGAIHYRNRPFDETFGEKAAEWIQNASRTVGGERGWLQAFFLKDEESHVIDVEFGGRVYRVERVIASGVEAQAAALSFDDVTRQREVEQAKSDFTSMIVHDLRGPLSGIQGTLEFVIGGDTRIDPLHEELLMEASRESERMMSLINELLDFSKIESGNFVVEHDQVRLAGVLKRAVKSLQQVAGRDSVYLLSAHGQDLPPVEGSMEKLTQVVINLISNAVKFTPKKGVISVGAQILRDENGTDSLLVSVTDSGIGIKSGDIAKIFEKYKQSGNKSLRGGGGTGLGLYIVKQVVEAHGGSVHIASIEGVGTSMMFQIPIRRAA